MKYVRLIGLCLMAVFAMSAVAASSASAGELLFKATRGNIVGGEFESLGGLSLLRTTSGSTVHCLHVDNHGKFLSTTLGNVLILFLGCTTTIFGGTVNCHNTGTNEIHLPLTTEFHLGLAHDGANTSIPAIDILLIQSVSFKCSIGTITVSGDAIGGLQTSTGAQVPLNTAEKETNLVYTESANGVQLLKEFLMPGGGLVTQHLSSLIENGIGGKETVESAETSTDTLKNFKNSAGEATEIELVEP